VLGLCGVFLLVLMGFAAMAVDVGSWYAEKRKLQSAADASALAGASNLPAGFTIAQSTASNYFSKNKDPGDAVVVTNTTTFANHDSVHVVATGTAQSFFAKVFGKSFVNLRTQATASVRTVTSYVSTGDVMPLVVMKDSYVPGTTYTIYGDGSSSNNGAVSLDVVSGNTCPQTHGGADWADTASGDEIACALSVNDTVETKPGLTGGKISTGINERLPGAWKTFNQLVTPIGNGQYDVIDATSKQIVIIPVVTQTGGSTIWPQGNTSVKIVGFATFVITGCGTPSHLGPCDNQDAKQLNGTFVNLIDATTVGNTGAWNPGSGTLTHVQLTG